MAGGLGGGRSLQLAGQELPEGLRHAGPFLPVMGRMCSLLNSFVGVLAPRASECDLIGRQGL